MRRTYERGTRTRPSFSGEPHAPVKMTDGMENAGSWTVYGLAKRRWESAQAWSTE